MEEINYGFWERVLHSIRPGDFYLHIRKETTNRALKYFLLIALILTSATFVKAAFSMNIGMQQAHTFVQNELPDFTLENGQLTVHEQMPIIKESGDGIFVVDTTGQYLEDVLDGYDSGVFIASDKLVYKQNSVESRTMKFSELKEFKLRKADILAYLGKWSGAVIAAIVIIGFLFAIAGKFIGLLAASLVGTLVNAIMKTHLKYEDILRTSAYVMTLPLAMKTVLELANINIPFFFFIYYGIVSYYFYLAFRIATEDFVRELD